MPLTYSRAAKAPFVALRALALGVVASACVDGPRSADTARLPTTVDTIGDTIRVRTGRGAAPALMLTPDARIANIEGNPDYELGRVSAIVKGPAGGIYLWDA